MESVHFLSLGCFLALMWITDGQMTKERLKELLALDCDQPSVTLHIFSTKPNPVWTMSLSQIDSMKGVVGDVLNNYDNITSSAKATTRIMGYQGFTVSCSAENQVFIQGVVPLEKLLLSSGRTYVMPKVLRHVQQYVGQSMPQTNYTSNNAVNCDKVPIRGPDNVPEFNPQTDNGGCFIKKQLKNNCYAYGIDIVTNTYPQPGRASGKESSFITCDSVRNASVRDGLIYSGTKLPLGQPKIGHFVALLIWPNRDYHWIRKDANSYWSHKPGYRSIQNKDNNGQLISNPSKSNLAPWTVFCAYYIAQPSKIHIK